LYQLNGSRFGSMLSSRLNRTWKDIGIADSELDALGIKAL
jgi:hypothetical protein